MPFILGLFQPPLLIEGVGGDPGDGGLRLLTGPGADGGGVLPRPAQRLLHRLVDGAEPLGLGTDIAQFLRSGTGYMENGDRVTRRNHFIMTKGESL